MRNFKSYTEDFLEGFIGHDVSTMAAALSFYTALSLAPLLLITLSIMGWFGPSITAGFIHEITRLVGEDAGQAVNLIIQNAQSHTAQRKMAGIMGISLLFFSASSVFAQLQSSLNRIWSSHQSPKDNLGAWVRKRLLSFGMVLTLAFLGLISLAASTVLSYLFHQLGMALWLVNLFVTWGVFGVVFAALFKYLPDNKLSWASALIGGTITAVLFSLGKELIGLYLGHSAIGSSYGAAGSMVVLLVWVYYSATIFFVGAEITRVMSSPKALGLRQ